MSWLGKLLSGPDAGELRARGEALLADGRPGEAKLAFERALERLRKGGGTDEVAEVEARIAACGDALARDRIAEAAAYPAEAAEHARKALDDAAEVARSEAVRAEVEAAREALERADAREAAADEPAPLTDEERLALLAGTWEGPQADEYEAHGEVLDRALLALAGGDGETAREAIEGLLAAATEPVYLHLEHARACAACDDLDGTRAALERFLAGAPRGVGDARLAARLELSRLLAEVEGFDAAVAALERAIEEHPADHRPLFQLGAFLRSEGHAEEAVEVLRAGAELVDETRPDWRLLQELGLAHRDAGQEAEAVDVLEGVLGLFAAQRATTLPGETLEALAGLHEASGNPTRAADLWRTLADGAPPSTAVRYHLEAARLVDGLGHGDEARRLLRRAAGLAEGDEDAAREIAARLEALG